MAFSDLNPPETWFTHEECEAFELMTPQQIDAEFDNFSWTEPRKLSWARKWRGVMLTWSDWTVLPDSALSESDQQLWRTYRQQLRDMFEEDLPVDEIVIPVQPWGTTPTVS